MAHAITMELLQLLEDKLGKEEGRKVAEAINIGLDVIEKKAEAVAFQKKLELRDELTGELASKADIMLIRQEMQTMKVELEAKIDQNKIALEGKIELVKADIRKLDMKLNFLIVLMIIALTLMNPVMAEIIKNLLKL